MQLYRKRYRHGGVFCTFFQLRLTEEELAFIKKSRLMDVKIHSHAGSLMGKRLTTMIAVNTFQAQVNRIRTRWSTAMTRTSGSVLLDSLIVSVKLIFEFLQLAFRMIFGTRKRLSSLIKGITYSSKRVEDIKEIEVFVLTSVAAIHQAIDFARHSEREDVFRGDAFKHEIAGLTFAGAGIAIAGKPESGAAGLQDLAAQAQAAEDEFDDMDEDVFDVASDADVPEVPV